MKHSGEIESENKYSDLLKNIQGMHIKINTERKIPVFQQL